MVLLRYYSNFLYASILAIAVKPFEPGCFDLQDRRIQSIFRRKVRLHNIITSSSTL